MKKGLRRPKYGKLVAVVGQNRRPDEEGIKTGCDITRYNEMSQNRRPDEEGIKTQPGGCGTLLRKSKP